MPSGNPKQFKNRSASRDCIQQYKKACQYQYALRYGCYLFYNKPSIYIELASSIRPKPELNWGKPGKIREQYFEVSNGHTLPKKPV